MRTLFILTFSILVTMAQSQTIDLLIKNGHVIDPKNNVDAIMDVAIGGGKILEVAPSITKPATKVVDVKGLYVVPGIIDIHTHDFYGTNDHKDYSNGYFGLPPDGFTFRAGVTTVVDAGSSGWRNFETFKAQTIDHSKTRVLAFINIVGSGMTEIVEQSETDMDPKLTAMMAKRYPDIIVGIKLAHFQGHDWTPTERAVEAGRLAGIPVMIDFGGATPTLSIDTLFNQKLRPGDIFTHCYAQLATREYVVKDGKVQPFVFAAQKRGIIFDVGHGGGSFWFSQAIPAIQQGFKPNSISTDIHVTSMNAGMKDMANLMSKMLNIGLTLNEVITMSTWHPAQEIHHTELGSLTPGSTADVAVFNLEHGTFGYVDVANNKIIGDKKLVCELTVHDGAIVYDLNGLSAELYHP